ncbi:MAG: LysM peptidoglycan-binding domain-containing protein [Acidimicrobiia bacterium]|nr:LysM peptidoglycan-binding domain-containing protein [Acidimicrobiia bacterium]
MQRKATAGLAGLIAFVVVLIIGLHQLGGVAGLAVDWSRPAKWVTASSPELAIGALLRQLGLIVGYWVLTGTALYLSARMFNVAVPRAPFVVLPVIRRLVDRAVAASLAVSLLGSPLIPAAAAEPPVVFEASDDGIPVPHVRVVELPPADPVDPPGPPAVVAAPVQQPSQPVARQGPAVATATTYVVVKGDNLWNIAAAYLELSAGSALNADHIGEYWRRVIEQNQTTLRSGDPNLIYPGEMIVLPRPGEMP